MYIFWHLAFIPQVIVDHRHETGNTRRGRDMRHSSGRFRLSERYDQEKGHQLHAVGHKHTGSQHAFMAKLFHSPTAAHAAVHHILSLGNAPRRALNVFSSLLWDATNIPDYNQTRDSIVVRVAKSRIPLYLLKLFNSLLCFNWCFINCFRLCKAIYTVRFNNANTLPLYSTVLES